MLLSHEFCRSLRFGKSCRRLKTPHRFCNTFAKSYAAFA